MAALFRNQMALVYVLLVVATVAAWGTAEGGATSTTATVVIVVIAAIKQRTVILYFMELRNAPIVWRCIFEVFVVLPAAGVLYCYWLARG